MTPEQTDMLRSLPAVGELLVDATVVTWCESHSRTLVVESLRRAIDEARELVMANGSSVPCVDTKTILEAAQQYLACASKPSLRRVINATGIVIHTGLGRAPLCDEAVTALADAGGGYCNIELDLETGGRGKRTSHVREWLCRMTGAEAATVVNNNAAAMVLTLRALCADREVVVSRGQLVEIGGSFRMPDIMTAAGCRLREVGTTNRTRIGDFEGAVTDATAAFLRVHHSNFKIVGFTEEPTVAEMAEAAHALGLLAIDDVGSGAIFDHATLGLPDEPTVPASIEAGMDVVCFSGDKLLGGPQAGLIVGRADLISRIESHPLMRTYRVDKLVLLALEATLRRFVDRGTARASVPVLRMLTMPMAELRERANRLRDLLSATVPGERFEVAGDETFSGGGALPGQALETVVVRWRPANLSAGEAVKRLRGGDPAVVARISEDRILFDIRTVRPEIFATLVTSVAAAAVDLNTNAT